MKRTALAVTAATVLLLLAGCTSTPAAEPAPVASAESETAPLAAETPAAADGRGEEAFVSEVRAKLRDDSVIPNATDEQLISAGQTACEAISNGENTITLSVIDGEAADASGFFPDSAVIISAARSTICD